MAYLQTSGTQFTLDGVRFIPYGGSIYTSSIPWSTEHIDSRISEAVAANFTMLRFINFLPHVATEDIEYDEDYWTKVDYALEVCRANGLKVNLDLSDYPNILHQRESQSYWTADWTEYLDFLCNRVNTVNERVYKEDDTIGLISILGEPNNYGGNEALTSFYSTQSAYLQSIAPNHLIGAGGIEWYNTGYPDIYALSTMDWFGTHPYDSNLGSFSNKDTRTGQLAAAARTVNKPLIFEEFGRQQRYGDIGNANYMRQLYNMGLKHGIAGFLFWNWNPGWDGASAYNIGDHPRMKQTYKAVVMHSVITSYSPRIPVAAADFADYY